MEIMRVEWMGICMCMGMVMWVSRFGRLIYGDMREWNG